MAQPAREAAVDPNSAQHLNRSTKAVWWTILSLIAFLLAEACLFRTGWYIKYLEPQSSAGQLESHLYWLTKPDPVKVPEVMILGDSRMGEGFSAPLADQAVEGKLHFWNLGIAGTTPRVWYYLLRDADPSRRRFAAIAIAVDGYADEDHFDSVPNRLIDLNFAIERLRWSDCWGFANSMSSYDYKVKAFTGCLFKGITLRSDVQAFLLNRADRIKRSEDWRKNGVAYLNDYGGRAENLAGLSADFEHRTIQYPPGLTQATKDTIEAMVMWPPAEQHGEMTRYRSLWLGRILDLYKDSPTKIIFFELARSPVPKPESRQPATFLHAALQRPNVIALPQNTFRDLERPEIFFDGLHFNKVGRGLFSQRIAEKIPPLLGIQ